MADSDVVSGSVSFNDGSDGATPPPLTVTPTGRDAIIRTVLGEGANQGDVGQAAITHVILNRVAAGGYGADPVAVVTAPNQFEANANGLPPISPTSAQYQQTAQIVDGVISGQIPDPTSGALNYLNPKLQLAMGRSIPSWASGTPTAVIGQHVFFNGAQPVAMTDSDIAAMYGGGAKAPAPMTDDDINGLWGGPTGKSAAPAPAPVAPSGASTANMTAPTPGALPAPGMIPAAPQQPAAALPLSNSPSDGYVSGLLKGAATGAIRGAANIVGTVGNLGNLADYLTDRAQSAITGVPLAQVQQANVANLAAVHADQQQSTLGQITNALDPRQWFPTGSQVAAPILARTGAYAPTTEGGRLAQTGIEAAVGSLGPGGAVSTSKNALAVAGNLAAAGGLGASGQGLADATGDPLVPMAAGVAIPGALGIAGRGVTTAAGRLQAETAALADLARTKYGIPIHAGQMSESPGVKIANSAVNRLPFSGAEGDLAVQQTAFNRAVTRTIGEDAPKVTPEVMNAAKQRIGQVFDDVGSRTTVAADPQFQNDLQSTLLNASKELSDTEMKPLIASFDNIMDKVQSGTIPGDVYNALRRTGSPLDRATDNQSSGTAYYARQIRNVLDDAFQRSASGADQAALIRARQQWANLKTIQPLAAKAPTGDVSPASLMNRVNVSTGNSLAFGGGGDLGDLARIGTKFLKEPGSSNTAERGATVSGLNQLARAATYGAAGFGAKEILGSYVPNVSPLELTAGAASIPATLIGGRLLGAGLRSNALAAAVIDRSLGRPLPPGLGSLMMKGSLPYLLQSAPGKASQVP